MIVVFGSINMDVAMRLKTLPKAGETVLAPSYDMSPGGKGANQALAAARFGAKTALVGKVGDDGHGRRLTEHLRRNEVMTSGVAVSDYLPTGMAFVFTDGKGENQIVVASGANADAGADQIPDEILRPGNILLLQMEAPPAQSAQLMKRARDAGGTIVLNLAPFFPLPRDAVALTHWLIVNKGEGDALAKSLSLDTGGAPAAMARSIATHCGVNCILTLGKDGAVCVLKDGSGFSVPALSIGDPVDTTGAGDCFCGTLAASLHKNMTPPEALRRASVAAGLSCLNKGAQESYPYSDEVNDALKSFPEAKVLTV